MEMTDYRATLRGRLYEKLEANSQLSMRAVAVQLGISHSMLSLVLNGKKNLSLQKASQVADLLEMSPDEKELFLLQVEYSASKSQKHKDRLFDRILNIASAQESLKLTMDSFKIMSEWYYSAIISSFSLKACDGSVKFFSEKLGLDKNTVQGALERLERLGLLEQEKGLWKASGRRLMVSPEKPSEAIRGFHKQMIQKSLEAVEIQDFSERVLSGLTLAFNKEDISLVEEEFTAFKNKISEKFKNKEKANSVYQMNLQFIELTRSQGNERH